MTVGTAIYDTILNTLKYKCFFKLYKYSFFFIVGSNCKVGEIDTHLLSKLDENYQFYYYE